ncbi:MAG: hypothetical protein RR630_01045 [Coprobacillus sp.]
MDIVGIMIVLGVCILISFIAMHFWVFICDNIIGGLKRLFHIGKKENINWHSLDEKTENISKDSIKQSKEDISENERLY